MGVYRLPWTPATKIWHFELTLDPEDTEVLEGARRSFCHLLETPTIWVSTYSPGPQQSRFDILGWLWTPRTLRSPRVPGGPFAIFVRNPNNMCVYRLPWTPAIAIWHFELTQDHLNTEDTEGARRSLCLSCSKPLQYGCLRTSLDPSYQDLSFWADSGPPGHWGCAEVTLLIYKSKQNPQKVQVDRRRVYCIGV